MAARGGPGLTLRGPRTPHLLLAAVGLLALGVRAVPVLRAHALTGWQSYDEGVHLAVAQRLLAGEVTYRDVFFAHPPGVVVAQVPVALLAQVVGEPAALAVSRTAVMVLGALTAILVARLLLPRGPAAAATGGLVAALFGPAVAADRISMLEPALSLGLVVALTALTAVRRHESSRPPPGAPGHAGLASAGLAPAGLAPAGPAQPENGRTPRGGARLTTRQRRALAIGGLALGLAVSVKLWALLDVAVLTAAVLARYGWRAACRWCAWTLGGVLVVTGPFVLAARGAFWRDVVVAQASRPRTGGLELGPEPVPALVAASVVASLLVLAVRARRRAPRTRWWATWGTWPDPAWWVAVGLVHLVALVVAPSYFLHYSAFLTVPLALVVGAGVGRLVARPRTSVRTLAAGAVALGAALLLSSLPVVPDDAHVDRDLLVAQAGPGCVWVREVEFLLVADLSRRGIDDGCPGQADLYGERMATWASGDPAADLDALDARVADQLASSPTAFLRAGNPFQGLGPRARAYLRAHFVAGPTTGRIEVWRRTT